MARAQKLSLGGMALSCMYRYGIGGYDYLSTYVPSGAKALTPLGITPLIPSQKPLILVVAGGLG